jgi:hypothetical protein
MYLPETKNQQFPFFEIPPSAMDTLYMGWPYASLLIGTAVLSKSILGAWPAAHGAGLGLDKHQRPSRKWSLRTRDVAWYMQVMLPIYMIHQFEEHGFDIFGRPYAFQAALCNSLVSLSNHSARIA